MSTNPKDDVAEAATNSPADPLLHIKKLRDRCSAWHQGDYERVSDKLREHLADCQKVVRALRTDKALRKAFYALCDDHQVKTKGASLPKIVVTFMFGIAGPRASAWARVIEIADDSGVTPEQLPGWLKAQGGIESVRRSYEPGQTPAEKVSAAIRETQEVLENGPALCVIENLPPRLRSNSDLPHSFSLALIRHDPAKNTGDVVWGTADDVLVRQYLLKVQGRVSDDAQLRKSARKDDARLAEETAAIRAALEEANSSSEAQVA